MNKKRQELLQAASESSSFDLENELEGNELFPDIMDNQDRQVVINGLEHSLGSVIIHAFKAI